MRTSLALLPLMVWSLWAQETGPERPATRRTEGIARTHPYPFKGGPPKAEELRARRAVVAERMGHGLLVLLSKPRSSKVTTERYRPDNNIYYLTGVTSDPAALVLAVKEGKVLREHLFLPQYSPSYELWNGHRVTAGEAAETLSGISSIVPLQTSRFGGEVSWTALSDAIALLQETIEGAIYLDHGADRPRSPSELRVSLAAQTREDSLREHLVSRAPKTQVKPASAVLGPARSIKSAYEIEMIQEAVDITREALVQIMSHATPMMWEFEFSGIARGVFYERGATGCAYAPICGAGPNSCVLHYEETTRQALPGELVLCDVGAEFSYYAADVTRTFPVSGRFTDEQRKFYEAVLLGQKAGERVLKPGATIADVDRAARQAMVAAGVAQKDVFPHGVGHHVGLDVHDPSTRTLEPGSVVTIEPGVYLKDRALGIRIEDVYLVTEEGCRRLSAGIPREASEIEALVGSKAR